jgi:hypothetical protein
MERLHDGIIHQQMCKAYRSEPTIDSSICRAELFVIGNAWHIGAARFCNGEYAFENVVPVHYAFFDCTVY